MATQLDPPVNKPSSSTSNQWCYTWIGMGLGGSSGRVSIGQLKMLIVSILEIILALVSEFGFGVVGDAITGMVMVMLVLVMWLKALKARQEVMRGWLGRAGYYPVADNMFRAVRDQLSLAESQDPAQKRC